MSLVPHLFIFDFEVTQYDWLMVAMSKEDKEFYVFQNDKEGLEAFMKTGPVLAGFNNKHYDNYILKHILAGYDNSEIFNLNHWIISGNNGWDYPLSAAWKGIKFDFYDLMDDCQDGFSLKGFEAHYGMDITESTVSFDIDHHMNESEWQEMIHYCKADVMATDLLDDLRQDYLKTKIFLGAARGLDPVSSMAKTNAQMTAVYLQAEKPNKPWTDERQYVAPKNLLMQYIPEEVIHFFNDMYDMSISDDDYFHRKLEISIGKCPVTIAFGGIHGAIPNCMMDANDNLTIRNKDVASYYPNMMRVMGYMSRNIPSPDIYTQTIVDRVKAKRAGDKTTSNCLKLVLNTTYGATKNAYNALYDPLMARSVCITGQLYLIELANHCYKEIPGLQIVQLNTDGIMVAFDPQHESLWQEITKEWETRTGFELEEDMIKGIRQKDVNNYVEIPTQGSAKIKGGMLVRGIPAAGAFSINNNATIVAKALKDYLADGIPVEDTIRKCDDLKQFQIISKVSSKYGKSYHEVSGQLVEVQKVNRVYATSDLQCGTLYKRNLTTGNADKVGNLPAHCIVDNDNHLTIDAVDKQWYIRLARKQVAAFAGEEPVKRTRRITSIKNKLLKELTA